MPASLLNGAMVAEKIIAELKKQISLELGQGHSAPGLAVIQVGEDTASTIYVRKKREACAAVGIRSYAYDLPLTVNEDTLLTLIHELNDRAEVHGILVQLPLPKHIPTQRILEAIRPDKDVDGFHPYNMGRLAQGNPLLRPCTPYGIMLLLDYFNLPVYGKEAVVIGASNIVGRPMMLELLKAKASVSICHRATQDLAAYVQSASILIVATGQPNIIQPSWLHENHVVVDVGIHRQPDGRLRGDMDFKKAYEKVAWITPVPGGIGPMTICTLLKNTFQAYSMHVGLS